ncbi:tetratricopeptide repeat protein [Silvanigrella paludirubra]|uniref:Tetratricopeptide repeat protein n=1 Tax=Silvanigrella paludirubra TaxID=2499159 RepID=A0A6N6VZN0_9BACT|nr:tetratricopeptide repeat protein [Silvanigrella paludirubra]KAB8039998.1 tetratricopeptide repeat protein [Silvanigrella paludirubra]
MSLVLELPDDLSFLIIDESDSFRNVMAAGLKSLGFKFVSQAPSSMIALENLRTKSINFVICELEMPVINGIELLKEIRDASDINRTAFLMISSNATREDIALLAEYEIDGFLKKPFSFQSLAQKIPSCMYNYNDPNNIESYFQEAKSYLKKGEISIALIKYEGLLRKSPNSCRARIGLATCYRALKNYVKAENLCKQAIEKNGLYVQSFDEMGRIYMAMNKIEEAIKFFKQAVSLSPNNPLRYEKITNLLIEQQRFKEAEGFLETATSGGVVYTNIYEQYGRTLFYQKKLEKASLYFEKALIQDPNNRSLINLMGICLKDLNKYEEALRYYNSAIKAYPSDTKVLFNKALCFFEMKEFEKSKKLCEYILTLDPNNQKAIKKIQEIELMPAQ